MAKEDFQTTTGFRSDYILTVTDSHFSPPTDKNPNASLVWSGVDEDGEEVDNGAKFGVGAGWNTFDGGETVDHPDGNETKQGKNRQFHVNSGYGKLINLFASEAPEDVLEASPGPRFASIWLGTMWLMEEVDNSFTPKTGPNAGKLQVIKQVQPTEFRGFADSFVAGNGGVDTATNGISEALYQQLVDAAMSAPDLNSFLEAALSLPGVAADDSIVSKLGDEDFYKSLITG